MYRNATYKKIESIDNNITNNLRVDEILSKYQHIFRGIGCLEKEYHIELKDNAIPLVCPARKVPLALTDRLKHALNQLEKDKIIKKVTGHTDWVNPIVIVKKGNGNLRICLDPFRINEFLKKPTFHLPTWDEIASKLHGSKYFSTLDATQGFLQIKLDKESSKLCTFATPFGRYSFCRLPYGLSCSSEVYQERMQQIFGDIEGCAIFIDDIICFSNSVSSHNTILEKILKRAAQYNIRFNKDKCKFLCTKITYMGHEISEKGIEVDKSKIQAILDMPSPRDTKDLQRFLGMVTYIARFVDKLSEKTAILRSLLRKDIVFQWSDQHEKAFQSLKQILSKTPCLQFFNIDQPTTISVDASQNGMAAVLMQNGRPCAHASRALTETQTRYSQIEKELLACWFGATRFYQYVFGKKFIIETDHKPLISIIKKPLYLTPPRLQRMLMQLKKYNFELVYKPGKKLIVADTLSRAFGLNKEFDENLDFDIESEICAVELSLNITDHKKQEIKNLTLKDSELSQLKNFLEQGWPKSIKNCPENIKFYYKFKEEISCIDQLIFKGQKLIVPQAMRKEILRKLHYSHLGYKKCINMANLSFFWPGMRKQIEDMITSCGACQTYQRSQGSEPMKPHDIPRTPWQKVAADIFQFQSESYLLIVDYYSKFVEVVNLNQDLTSKNLINKFKSVFARFGIPKVLMTDNASNFCSLEFKQFSRDWEFQHTTSSPLYPQSNGQVERSVQSVKNLLKKCFFDRQDPYLALLNFRNIPLDGENSSANALMHRNLRSIVPETNNKFLKKFNKQKFNSYITKNQQNQKKYYNKRTKTLSLLKNNQLVKIQIKPKTPWQTGKILKKVSFRSYLVQIENGKIFRRNRKFIREFKTSNNFFPQSSQNAGTPESVPELFSENNIQNNKTFLKIIENSNDVSMPENTKNVTIGNNSDNDCSYNDDSLVSCNSNLSSSSSLVNSPNNKAKNARNVNNSFDQFQSENIVNEKPLESTNMTNQNFDESKSFLNAEIPSTSYTTKTLFDNSEKREESTSRKTRSGRRVKTPLKLTDYVINSSPETA